MSEKRCPVCGSGDLIPDVPIRDGGGMYPAGRHEVVVAERPMAVFGRGEAQAELRATICGACGYAMLFATEPGALWRAYRERREGPRGR